jgi:hypothetical protein
MPYIGSTYDGHITDVLPWRCSAREEEEEAAAAARTMITSIQ